MLAEPLQSLTASGLSVDGWQDALAASGAGLITFREATGGVSSCFGLASGKDRILHFLRRRVGVIIDGSALAGVSGIGEWARRVRELRVEDGWPIESGVQRPGLRTDQYVLIADEPDEGLAAAWRLATGIRGSGGSGRSRALTLLQALSPNPVDQDQLSYVAKIKSWQRRVRELEEDGWDIRSNIDEPGLAPGTYRLHTLQRRPARARRATKLRNQILERDAYTCADCGAERGGPGVRLQVHHVVPRAAGGKDVPENLITLCANDHAGRHASMSAHDIQDELVNPESEDALKHG